MPNPKILIVDDKVENLYALEKLLQKLDADVIQATSGSRALELMLEYECCLAIVDVQMPEMDGYELVELLRSNESTSNMPVIFVSAIYSDEYHHRRGYDAGAVDFMSKPFVPEILLSKVKVFLDLCLQRRRLEKLVTQLNNTNATLSQYARQLETSTQVSQQITSILELDTLLKAVVNLIQTKFEYYYVSVWLWDETHHNIVLHASAGRATGPEMEKGFVLSREYANGIIGTVCQRGSAQRVNDVSRNPLYIPIAALSHTRSELAVPLRIGSHTLGALDIQSETQAAFDIQAVNVLQALGDQVAIAIRNVELYTRVVHFNEELEAKVDERTEELQRAYAQLELLDRNKSDFIQVVSHELRTPLTLIQGHGQLLLKQSEALGDTKYTQHADGVMMGVKRLHEIVGSMLDIARIDTRTLQLVVRPIEVSQILEQLHKIFASVLQERNLTFTLKNLGELPEIEADPDTLTKLFEHLLTNAIKYTPDGGAITVGGRLLNASANVASDFVEITFSDTGIGIAPELQDLIFTKFYCASEVNLHSSGKTKFKGGGPGLGLAIAKGIVEAHGGRIWVKSPGYDEETYPGSQFHVILPVKQQKPGDAQSV